jgi:hypothetical protein
MDNKIIELLSEEIRETRNLTIETRKLAVAALEESKNSKRQADAAWELVVITRNEMYRPLWKIWFGFK